jgi:hypothetical protein
MRHKVGTKSLRIAQPVGFATIFLAASAVTPAYAYLDPGTGSMMLQLMLGGVAGLMVVGKLYLRRAQDFFRSISGRKERPE